MWMRHLWSKHLKVLAWFGLAHAIPVPDSYPPTTPPPPPDIRKACPGTYWIPNEKFWETPSLETEAWSKAAPGNARHMSEK